MLWWMLWAGVLAALIGFAYARRLVPMIGAPRGDVAGLAALLASCFARWWVLPRVQRVQTAFVLFVAGMTLAETCGLVGVYLGAHQTGLLVAAVVGILQWMPLFARRFAASAPVAPPPEADGR